MERRCLLAAVPTLIKDVNIQPDQTFEPLGLYSTGSVAYFSQQDPNFGEELWKTDGTPAGTVMVKDIWPGKAGSRPTGFVQLGSSVYFSAGNEASGGELWKTDGTAAGTVMVADIVPGAASAYPTNLRAAGSNLFFFATTPATGYEVWKSDGTAAGTALVTDLRPGTQGQAQYNPERTGTVGSTYLYAATNGTTSGIYRTDGTAAGTYLLRSSSSGFDSFYLNDIISGGSRALLTSSTTDGTFLSTDGTVAGTITLGDAYREFIAVVGSNVFYFDVDYYGYHLYRKPLTGGTATEVTLPAGFTEPLNMLAQGTALIFTATTSSTSGINLYRAASNAITTSLLKDFTAYDNQIFAPATVGTTLYFLNLGTQELWKTDGTTAGTVVAHSVNGVSPDMYDLGVRMAAVGSRLVFANKSSTTGTELWSSSGTAASFAILKDINTGTAYYGSSSVAVGRIGNTLFYQLNDGLLGGELWKTDGTAAGTSLVKDIVSGSVGSMPYGGVTIGSRLLFRAYNPASGTELWSTDGTTAGTNLVLDIAPGTASSNPLPRVALNGIAYFSAGTAGAGQELWRTDGTAAGTYLVKDIYAGTTGSEPSGFTVANGRLYFAAYTSASGVELWSSDGTADGTTLVKDINPGATDTSFSALTPANGKLFFTANDSASGSELWMSDGTSGGTARVADLAAGSGSSSPNGLTQIGSTLFFSATTPATGRELFKLDLNTMQASLAADIVPGSGGSFPRDLVRLGGTLCFIAEVANTSELFTFEGGVATKRSSFPSGEGAYNQYSLRAANGALYFTAGTANTGLELYQFHGAPASVPQMIEIYAGIYSSAPYEILALPDAIAFVAGTPEYGHELMRLADTTAPRAWQTSFEINTGPRVRVEWTEATIATANSATLITRATNQPVPGVSVIRTLRADGSGVDYTFSAKLPDGDYRLSFNAADFRDAAGNTASGMQQQDFFILAGDLNRDRKVGFEDLVILAQNYGRSGRTFGEGNADHDAAGNVDFTDLVLLAQQYNKALATAAPAIAAKVTSRNKRAVSDVLV